MSNTSSMFVPVGKNIYDLNSITNIEDSMESIKVYIKNNLTGYKLSETEYEQLMGYYFGENSNTTPEIIPMYVKIGRSMFRTSTITHVIYSNDNAIVYIDSGVTMDLTEDEYDLLIKYLLAS